MCAVRRPITLMRLLEVNILNTIRTVNLAFNRGKKYFCVSTDKAAGPVNLMGASKRGMELALMSGEQNVAVPPHASPMSPSPTDRFSMGSPSVCKTPTPVRASRHQKVFCQSTGRGHLCLMSCLLGANRIFSSQGRRHNDLLPLHEIA